MKVALSGYGIGEAIYSGTRTLVYRGQRASDNQRVVIKFLRNPYPTFTELLQFRNQYTIAKNLNISGIVRPESLEPYGNSYALVMGDEGGISLREYIQTHDLKVTEILAIALQLANILQDLHQHRVIHKDIKPANILIHPETKQVKLIDFSIASLLPKETQEITNPHRLEGTLAYLAPEQTGRMNRGIDYRADFYALGITLFELFTGQLPFESKDAMELVHCHIAKQPPALGNCEEMPSVLADIVMKLMAKNAEDRYQSALGLKYDLEICLHQLRETGKIEVFKIGQRDLYDRFTIPEKLYGREREVKILLAAFDRVAGGEGERRIVGAVPPCPPREGENYLASSPSQIPNPKSQAEIMLVAGFSGIGKTAVINEVHKPITRQKGYFIKGKFDQFKRDIPFSGFVQALRDLMGQLLSESDAQLAQWRAKILESVGENGQVLIEVIPELEIITGKQPPAPELSATAAQHRFNLLFQKFLAVFTTKEHPLVIFLDDLQWADLASLQLIKLLVKNRSSLLLLGAYRDNEVSPVHPFMLMVEEVKKTGTPVNTITLSPLAFSDTNQLVADTLHCSTDRSRPLTELIDRKTKGNPFFTTQFLKALHEDGYIKFNHPESPAPLSSQKRQPWGFAGGWFCDLVQVKALSLTDDVVEFMAQQLEKLPAKTQEILQLAACVGNSFDLKTLAIVSDRSPVDVADALWKALQEGLILPQSEVYKFYLSQNEAEINPNHSENVQYRFLHDRVQQAAYSLIPQEQKQIVHLQIGRSLWQNTLATQQAERIFEIVGQFNAGIELITEPAERQKLAELNLTAGRKAKESTAYSAALEYLDRGIELLPADSWQTTIELTQSLYEEAAEAAFSMGDFQRMQPAINTILQNTDTLLDTVRVYELKILALQMQGQAIEAIALAREILQKLGITLPEAITPLEIYQKADSTLAALGEQKIEDLVHLPMMTDPQLLAAQRLMASLIPCVFAAAPYLFPVIACETVMLFLKSGNSSFSPPGYADFGIIAGSVLNKLEAGYQFGNLALKMLDIFPVKATQNMTKFKVAGFILFNRQHIRDSIALLQEAYTGSLETGDFLHMCASAMYRFLYLYFSGTEVLENIPAIIAAYQTTSSANEIFLLSSKVIGQTIHNLTQFTQHPDRLVGECVDEEKLLPVLLDRQETFILHILFLCKSQLAYLFGDFPAVLNYSARGEQYLQGGVGMPTVPLFHYYYALARLAVYPTAEPSDREALLLQVQEHHAHLKFRAEFAPMNFQHLSDLVEAELHQVLGNKTEAIDCYERAIALAQENDYLLDEALANELAGKFYLNWHKEKAAQGYIQEAYYCYARWGAKAKVEDLEQRYPQLLQPIVQQRRLSLNPLETFATATISGNSFSGLTSTSTGTKIDDALDFASILKAAQAISSSIELDELMASLTRILLENSGAKKVALILFQDETWQVRAITFVNHQANSEAPIQTLLDSQPLDTCQDLPRPLINYVKNTQQTVIIDRLKTHIPGLISDYMLLHQPQSVCGTPIVDRGNLAGILYLENQLTSGVFTSERLQIIKLLSAQAAISLENARLYQQAQRALQDLQQAQLQIVQSEKMSALGNLVAGVAHEMNNPLGFIAASLEQSKPTVAELIAHLKLYQETFSEPGEEILNHAEEIDIEYSLEDFPKVIQSMSIACERLKNISTSLRTFSRADRDYKVPFNIHEGIESTLLILKHRLKANQNRPEISVVTEYGNLPNLECFPGQLNQVFMNILANAIDALDESNSGRSYAQIQANPNRITIQTSAIDNQVIIAIADNGTGMSESVKARIFDHLFTTKAVGKGTGLGLAIARQIVVETHGGRIEVNSTLGQGTIFTLQLPVESSESKISVNPLS